MSLSDAPESPGLLKRRLGSALVAVVVVGLFVLSARQTGVEPGTLATELPTLFSFTLELFPPAWGFWSESIGPMLETIQIAIISTTVGAVLSIPFGFMAARNVMTSVAGYGAVRTVLSIFRTLPEIIVAAVFVAAVGLGPLAGVMALILFTFGFVAKLLSESIEAIDPGPPEAIRASGANSAQVAVFGILPQVLPQFLSYSLYSFEVNVRVAVVLGIVGAGGIGQLMLQTFQFLQYDRLSTIIIVIFVAVVLIDYLSNRLRRELV
ncbi:MAG: phosphonate ABC transporter, permease protein PhnE [Rubrobacteraceae bacterium]